MNSSQSDSRSEEDIDDLDEVNEVIPATYSITSDGADYPVDGLVKRLEEADIVIPLFSMHSRGTQDLAATPKYLYGCYAGAGLTRQADPRMTRDVAARG